MEVYRLENDLTMYYTRIPTAQSIAIGMYVKCGSQNEIKQQNGISHMLEHMHFRRLGQMYSDEIYHETESMGATLSAVTYKDFTKYEMKIRPRFLPKATQLFRLLIEHDTWNSEDLESERIIVRREMLEKTAYFDLDYYVDRLLFKNHPLSYPIIGSISNLDGFTVDQLIEYKHIYYNSGNIAFFITGNVSEYDIQLINHTFSSVRFTKGKQFLQMNPQPCFLSQRKPDTKLLYGTGTESTISIFFDFNYLNVNPEALVLLNAYLGEGDGSVLQSKIREKHGYSYSISSYLNVYGTAGNMEISYTVSKKQILESIKLVLSVLAECRKGIKKNALDYNKPFYTENLWYWLEQPMGFNQYLARKIFIWGEKPFTIEEKIQAFYAITEPDLLELAKHIFQLCNLSVLIDGAPTKLTNTGLRQFLSDHFDM